MCRELKLFSNKSPFYNLFIQETKKIVLIFLLAIFSLSNGFSQTVYYANSLTGNDSNNGLTPATAKKTFTEVYNTASANDTLDLTGTFTWTDAGEITGFPGFFINKNIVIRGQGADQTIIQAHASPDSANERVFVINYDRIVEIQDLTIRHGYSPQQNGGGILLRGNLSILRCNLTRNSNGTAGNTAGGAISIQFISMATNNPKLTVNQSIFQFNTAGNGAAIEDAFGSTITTEIYISNTVFYSNNSTGTLSSPSATVGGGAIKINAGLGKAVITNCTFTKNNHQGKGAAIYNNLGNVYIKNNIFSGNRSGSLTSLGSAKYDVFRESSGDIYDNGGNIYDRILNTSFSTNFTIHPNSWYRANSAGGSISVNFKLQSNTSTTGSLFLDSDLTGNVNTNGMSSVAILNANSIAIGNAVTDSNDVIPQQNTDIRDAPRPSSNFTIGAYEYVPCFGFDAEAPTLDNGVYQISTFNHLRWISENSSSWGADFIQTADIDAAVTAESCYNSGEGWSSIGNVSTKFTGTYDGDGQTISNLFINRPNEQRIALFGETNGATIEHLGLVDPDITVTGTGQFGMGSNVGSLVGLADNGTTISECFASGGVVTAGGSGVGGLIGQLLWSSLNNSYAIVTVEGGDANINYSGGLVGVNSSSTITNCYAAGSVVFKQYSGITISRGLTQGTSGITNSFYDSDATGQTTGGGTAKTTAEMLQQATFTDWDFQCETENGTDDFWGIDEGNDYPRLSWEGIVQLCKSWIGSINTDWSNPNNWSPSGVPAQNENLIIDATAQNNLILDQDQSVGNITFNAADVNIILGDYDLTFSDSISGADADNYIQTNGTGKLTSSIAANSNMRFEVGRSAYNPVEIQPSVADTFAVLVKDTIENNNYLNLAIYVNRTWEITKADSQNNNAVDFIYHWNNGDVINGPINDPILNHYNGNIWENANGINSPGSGSPILSLSHTNYTGSFSPFAISDDSTPLPVDFLGMDSECEGKNSISLTWETASELNAKLFEVLRSYDGYNWNKVGEVAANGTTNNLSKYRYENNNLRTQGAVTYYRLKQIDYDGKFEYLPIISNSCGEGNLVSLYPNPAKDKFFVALKSNMSKSIKIRLIDSHGKVAVSQNVLLNEGLNTIPWSTSDLAPGVYYLHMDSEFENVTPLKVVVNN